jgi:hypothetical protein
MTDSTTQVSIARRFAGPPTSGNGGYTAGLLAAYAGPADQPVTVTLRTPPPLETPLHVTSGDGDDGVRLLADETLVAEARPGTFAGDPVPVVSVDEARTAESAYRGLTDHPFPGCFVCGTAREEGVGLGLRPGLFAPGRTACVWTPHPSLAGPDGRVAPVFIWSALDCPGGWTSDLDARPLVLGRMTASTVDHVSVGTAYVVVGQLLEEDGRKTFTATTAYDDRGQVVGRAEHVWIAIDPARFS